MRARLLKWWDKRSYSQTIALALFIGFGVALILRQLVSPLDASKGVGMASLGILALYCVLKMKGVK